MTSVAVTTQQASVTVTTASGVTVVPTTQTAAVVVQAGVVAPGGIARDILEKVSGADNHTRWTSTPELDAIGFDMTAGYTAEQGQLAWNADEQTLDLGKGGGVTLQIGSEQLSLCRNSTASTIPNGTAVRFAGTLGNSGRLLVAPMVADGSLPGYVFFGVTTQAIAAGADGFVCTFGKVRQVDTRAFAEGAILWCNPAAPGGFTATEPHAPNLKLPVAAVISSATNGIIFVRSDTGRRLQDLHDVDANGGKSDGDVLTWVAAAGRWEAAAPTGGGVATDITETKQVIASDYTITTGKNGLSVSVVEVADGYTVTVPAGAVWLIAD
jgi:hypothetical protein